MNKAWVERLHQEALMEDAQRDYDIGCDLMRQGFDDFGLCGKPVALQADLRVTARPRLDVQRIADSIRATDAGESTFQDFLAEHDFRN